MASRVHPWAADKRTIGNTYFQARNLTSASFFFEKADEFDALVERVDDQDEMNKICLQSAQQVVNNLSAGQSRDDARADIEQFYLNQRPVPQYMPTSRSKK